MWYGNVTTAHADEADRIVNESANEQRKARIAKWIADAAIQRAKEQIAFHKLIQEQVQYPKILKKDTVRRRIARGLW